MAKAKCDKCPKCGAVLQFGGDFELEFPAEPNDGLPVTRDYSYAIQDAACPNATCGWEGAIKYKVTYVRHVKSR